MKSIMNNTVLTKRMNRAATIVSVVVLLLVASMRQLHLQSSIDFRILPAIYSATNLITAVFLIAALFFIRQKNIQMHRRMIVIALGLSFIFLALYVLYHLTTPETKYCGVGLDRTIYFFLLTTHIVCAAVGFPFILFTFVRGYTMQVERHKKMARWVYWVWLYITITGPVVYMMLKPCYGI